ncbi:hypothetical protein D3C84_865840 [compost metagenome]
MATFQRIQFVVAQLPGQFGLGDRISARRPAAQMAVGHRCEVETEASKERFHRAAELLRVLQSAGAMEGQTLVTVDAECFQRFVAQHFHQVPGQRADPFCLLGVGRIAFE